MAKSNVELVIRARNEASRALRTISEAIQDVIGGQKELATQAGSTESRMAALGRELEELSANFSRLRDASRLATALSKAEKSLRQQTDAVMAAQREVNELAYAYERTENPTKRMTQQLQAAERRLERARDKTGELRARVTSLAQEYDASRVAAGAFGASQEELANLTSRAGAEFAELQTRLRETRNLSRGALSENLGDLDVGNLGAVTAALGNVEGRLAELRETADLTGVDLKEVAAEIDQLEGAAKSLGELRQLAETFGVMRRESRELLQAFNESQQRTEQLAREFKNAEAPSRELGEALGRSRAETSRLANDYQVAQGNVRKLGEALRDAGVDVSRLGVQTKDARDAGLAPLDRSIEEVASTLARSRVALDEFTDAQRQQIAETQRSEAAMAEAARAQEKYFAQVRRRDYTQWWESALEEREALRANAAQVAESSRVHEQAAAAVEEASTAYRNAAAQVDRAGDAYQQATAQVARLQQEQAQVAARVEESSTAYSAARERLAGFAQQIENTSAPSAQLVQQFEEAQEEVKRLANDLKDSEREYKGYEQAIRSAETALSGLAEEQQRARERATALESSASEVQAAYDALGTTLRENRGNTEAVAEAQRRLMSALDGSANALSKSASSAEKAERRIGELSTKSQRADADLRRIGGSAADAGQGVDRLSESVRRVEANLSDFRDQGRTTLSLMQRLRGQVLALTSAYIGLYGVGSGVNEIINASLELEAAQSRLRVAVGDSNQAVGEELEYVKRVAEELKLEFRPLTEAYSRYAVAARTAGASGDETRSVFLGLAKAARVNKLSGDQLTRAFRAIEQIFSQGKVQAEELREQLADAGLAGVVNILADSLGVTGEELNKMLEQGEVGSKALIPLAAELEKVYGPGLSSAIETTSASIANFRNQVYEIQLLIGESGFLDSFAEALERVAEELQRPDARQGLQDLGAALGETLVTLTQWLDHIDEIILAMKIFAAAMGVKFLVNITAGMVRAGKEFRRFTDHVRGARGALLLFYRALSGIGLLLVGLSLAEWAAKEFPAFGVHWYRFREMIDQGVADIRHAFGRLGVYLSGTWEQTLNSLGVALRDWISKDFLLLAEMLEFAGGPGKKVADAIRKAQEDFAGGAQDEYLSDEQKKALKDLEDEHARTAEEISKRWAKMRQDLVAVDPNLTPDDPEGREFGGLRIEDMIEDPYEVDWRLGGGDEAQALADDMERELDRVQQRLAELSADTLDERLALIRAEFDDLVAYLESKGNQAGLDTVDELVGLLEAQEKANYLKEQAREAENEINKAYQHRRDLMEAIDFYRDEGDSEAEERLKKQLQGVNAELRELIDNEIERLRTAGGSDSEAAIASLERQRLKLIDLKEEFLSAEQINQQFASGASEAFVQLGTEIGRLIQGTQSWSETFRNAGDAFRQFAADFLRQIAEMIIQATILNALTGSPGGGIGGAIVGMFHRGGIAGTSQGGPSREVSPLWFRNAVRYHDGGMAGLQPGEVPAILQRGEEVLTRDDPRHAMNGSSSRGSPMNVKVVNAIDSASVLQEGMNTSAGQKTILNFMRANKKQIKSVLS